MEVIIRPTVHEAIDLVVKLIANRVAAKPDIVLGLATGRTMGRVYAGLVVEPFARLVPLRELQPFLTPEPLDLLVIDPPALDVKQLGDLAIAISPVLLRQPDRLPIATHRHLSGLVDIAESSAPNRLPGIFAARTWQASGVC